MKQLIKKLTETYGPSGNEHNIRKKIKEEIQDYVDELRVDNLGNLIAVKKGNGKKIMVAAHMDEVGLIVTSIDEKGFLRFSKVGGVSEFYLLGQRVIFENGIIATLGTEKLESMKELKMDKMFIDIGAKDKKEAEQMISIGDQACYYREFSDLNKRIIAKALDDRIGCCVLIQTIKDIGQSSNNEIYFVFTVQEEVGLRGAKTSAFSINPDIGIAVDVTATGDTPKAKTMAVELGKGPAIKIKDNSILCHPKVRNHLIQTAEKNNIPYQLEVLEFGGTDSGAISVTKEGIPSGAISIPCRYIHTPSEMIDYDDVLNATKLLTEALISFE